MKHVPLTIILMVHNEEDTIAQDIKNYYIELVKKIPNTEFIIAEDGSKDKTRIIIHNHAKKYYITPLISQQKRGYANSLHLAFTKAKGDLIFYADAGGKHDPKDFWELYKKIDQLDLVTGYKAKRHDPPYRLFLAWGLNKIVNIYFHVSFKDIDCGFKLLTRRALQQVLKERWILKENISLEIVLRTVYAGFATGEVPIKHTHRQFGPSRGLPPKKIPRVVYKLLLQLSSLKIALERLHAQSPFKTAILDRPVTNTIMRKRRYTPLLDNREK